MLGTYYQIEAAIGQGGMATVYRARHTVLESQHAVKLLLPHLAARRDVRLRFLEEGKIQARLRHPHIAPVTDLISDEGVAGLVMQWLDGRDLRRRLDEDGPLPAPLAVRLALQALDALSLVHEHGVIHRDLKPANLFLEATHQGTPHLRVMDFGIAKVTDKARTRTTTMMGSCAYMSPEQIESPKHLDHRSDLFSMGAVLFEMLSGAPAFEADTDFETMRRITSGALPPLPGPPSLHPILARALARDPAERYPDADAFADALRAAVPDPLRAHRLARLHARARALQVEADAQAAGWPAAPSPAWLDEQERHLDHVAQEQVALRASLEGRLRTVSEAYVALQAQQEAPPADGVVQAVRQEARKERQELIAAQQVELEAHQRQLEQTRMRERIALVTAAVVVMVALFRFAAGA